MKERLVPVPQDVLYAHLRDKVVSRKIGAIKEIVEVSKPSFIRTKIAFTGALGHVDIHIIPQRNVSRISYSFDFKRFFLTFLLVDMLAYTILFSLTLSQYVPFQVFRQLTALTTIFGVAVPLYTYVDSKRRFSEQLELLLQLIILEYEHKMKKSEYYEVS